MSILSSLFGGKKKNEHDEKPPIYHDKKPPIYGGDGLSDHSPAIVNCASMGMAQSLIDNFISEKCGKEWERVMEFTLDSHDNPNKSIRMISVKTSESREYKFYFDLSRPLGVAMKMLGL